METCNEYKSTFQLPECLNAEFKYQVPFAISYEGEDFVLQLCSLALEQNPLKAFSRLPILQPNALEVLAQ